MLRASGRRATASRWRGTSGCEPPTASRIALALLIHSQKEDMMTFLCRRLLAIAVVLSCVWPAVAGPDDAAKRLAPFFRPPPELAKDLGKYRSPLLFEDGTAVRNAADWARRRREILTAWHGLMGPWPELLEKP